MQFPPALPRGKTDTLLPMINVVFLLLIFFLISAKLTPPEPFTVAPPLALDAQEAEGIFTLFVDPQGDLGFQTALGDAAIAALSQSRDMYCGENDCEARPAVVFLRADGALPATDLAKLIGRLTAAGFVDLMLVTAPQGAGQ